jgi:hypothetical protein
VPSKLANAKPTVRAHFDALPRWQHDLARRIDAMIAKAVPDVKRGVKWHSAVYGLEGKGLFAILSTFQSYLKLNFYRGALLRPVPPSGVGKEQRSIDIREGDALDDKQVEDWMRQAAKLQGFGT